MSRQPVLDAPTRPATRPGSGAPERAAARPDVAPRRSTGGWRWFFRGYEPRREGTMPAGIILVLMVLTLVVAAFLNADATLRKSNSKDKGAWRQDTAQALATA